MILCHTAAEITASLPLIARLTPTTSVVLLRLPDGSLRAYRNACPHMGIELDWDARRLLTRNGRYLQCTGHGAQFDPRTGLCLRGPCKGETLTPLPIRTEGNKVELAEGADTPADNE